MYSSRYARRAAAAAAALVGLVLVSSCSASPAPDRAAVPAASAATASPSGAHGTHAAPPPAAPLRAGERFVNLSMPQPYTPVAPNGGTDEYRCFLIDPKLADPSYLIGSQFLPQNGDLVHHAILFQIGPNDVPEARRVDAGTPGEGWTCFGDAGVGERGGEWVGHWAPGANETLLKPGLGYPMAAGGQLVVQVHYNLLRSGGKAGGADQSGLRLRLADGSAAMVPLHTGLLQAPVELPCAAGESGPLCDRETAVRDVAKRFGAEAGTLVTRLGQYCGGGKPPAPGVTQRCDHKMESNGTVHAVAGHMHLLGRSIKVELNPGTPKAKTLLDLPQYNFDDQAIRPLAQPVEIVSGDTLRVTCTHDAGLRRQLPELRPLPARYVVWGDGTSDEMCLGILVTAART